MKNYINPHLKRKLTIIALISLLLASAVVLYTFGINSGFFSLWMRAFFVFFTMIALTVLAVVPGVNYLVNKAAGR